MCLDNRFSFLKTFKSESYSFWTEPISQKFNLVITLCCWKVITNNYHKIILPLPTQMALLPVILQLLIIIQLTSTVKMLDIVITC
jgi:hypothetical protein